MASFVYLLVSLAIAQYTRYRFFRVRQDVHALSGPSSSIASWLWGHELLVFQHESTQLYSIWAHTFGSVFRIKAALFHEDIIVAADHAAVQHIFADTDNYVANVIGKGLVWAEGDDHKTQRRILNPAFSLESIKGMTTDIVECCEKIESSLVNRLLAHTGGVTVNIVEYMSSCTLNIIGRVAFGHDFKSTVLETSSSEPPTDAQAIRDSWNDHVNTGLTPSAFLAPLVVRAIPAITKAPLPLMQTQGAIKMIVRRLAGRLMQNGHGLAGGQSKDIFSILLNSRKGKEQGERGLTDEQILDNVSTFMMVGHETTAGSANFTLLELARRPDIQQKLRQEVIECGHELSYDHVQKLPYLDAIVKEGLRLYPASPQTERVALKDDVIPLSKPIRTSTGRTMNQIKIRKGQVIHIPFTTMQTNPAVWGPDAASFKPERWLIPGGVPPPSELPHGWSGLVTFCDGPRMCIGYRLAILEFKIILATLVRSLQFHDTEAVVLQKISPTLQAVTDGRGGLLPLHITLA
ncbi:hypothetical protein SERLA73DRAFT_149895 [Serpula lacrymans var. lacrymans S7.3]|uniref:Cytochrome P450 n=2 Tax=Serpula lacrymans var. lacrymans TaxID=341189 RepID=F8PIP3_SERL3|nr:uncharacterized protein SERLADRAFT_405505 [Serpula lacrymans var. lacrymans S7.9]EGO03676.1 hypothetical protein SERLA73DRAFT_149895 [Serpula lacrymans var. lacrymans S7.3]EGO29539.1 hypothetical protein SERLADRAFT_405505 [Serpula lacrymans var. lacrymans S7.9]